MIKRALEYWPLILGITILAAWSIFDRGSFLEWEGLALLALLPLGFWAVLKGSRKGG
jgi:hypothetical protein